MMEFDVLVERLVKDLNRDREELNCQAPSGLTGPG